MTYFNDFMEWHIADGFLDVVFKSLIFTVAFYVSLVVLGFVINCFEKGLLYVLRKIVGNKAALFICNRLTFVGTVLHECSHALFVVLTGGKLLHISFYDVFRGNQLGHVDFVTRGGRITRSFQLVFTSCAPVLVLGTLSCLLIFKVWSLATIWWQHVILGYIIVSCVCHMSMSAADIRNYVKGLFLVYPVSCAVCFIVFWVILAYGR